MNVLRDEEFSIDLGTDANVARGTKLIAGFREGNALAKIRDPAVPGQEFGFNVCLGSRLLVP